MPKVSAKFTLHLEIEVTRKVSALMISSEQYELLRFGDFEAKEQY
jgi:hypothetical protein